MEQKDNKTVNPIADAFNALAETLNINEAAEDGTALFGALLNMPDEDFKSVSPVILDEINRSLNNPNDRFTLVSLMAS